MLEAGYEAFAEYGLRAQMDDVARRAGVGLGTVYRHFPTKDSLVAALIAGRYEELADEARQALDDPDPWEGFRRVMWRVAEMQATDRSFAQVVVSQVDQTEAATDAKRRFHEVVARLVARAQQVGELRRDVTAADLPVIFCGLAGVAATPEGDAGPPPWHRYVSIILDGLYTGEASRRQHRAP